ncbi:MAG TPA: ion channel [Bacteroidota bacterium]|nr:ion channel [Bacteroidota bacterium]
MSDKKNLDEDLRDLGFGSRVARESPRRLLNKDGTFNVERKRLPFYRSLSPYHYLLTITWTRFYLLILSSYLAFNLLFALGYYLAGPGALEGAESLADLGRFTDGFFFSIQTSTTIGYGRIAPVSMMANTLASTEALISLLSFALATSLMFARFSRPEARILYSTHAVIAPFRNSKALMFRIANQRNNQLIQVGVQVLVSWFEPHRRNKPRRFVPLDLERESVVFFPLTWTVVHPINERSPLANMSEEEFRSRKPEFLVLITAIDETFSQTVYSRSSYTVDEVIWGAKFSDIFSLSSSGVLSVDLHRVHAYERVSIS